MGMQWKEQNGGELLEVRMSGKVAHDDYERFVPEFDNLVQEKGLVSILYDMTDFQGWTPRALWDEIKLDLRHFGDVKHVAMVGDKKWEEQMAVLHKPFTRAQVRYFDRSKIDEARNWVQCH